MDFGDLDFDFSCEINPNEFDQIKEKFFGLYQELYSKHQSISDNGGILYEGITFNDDKKSIDITVPKNWQSNELFVLFLLQTKALDILEIPGFHRHIPSDLNNFSLEAKEDFFKFSNQLFKETDSGFYADWQVFTDGMYWSMGIEVNPNNEGDSPIVDFRQTAYEEDEYEDW